MLFVQRLLDVRRASPEIVGSPDGRTPDLAPDEPAPRGPVRVAARTCGALGLLSVMLPANLAITSVALMRGVFAPPTREALVDPKTILISGGKMTKALQLARSFHRVGHRVILVESEKYRLTGHRFSRAVDRFYTVPKPQDSGYAAALLDIVQREGVDIFVPVCSPVASFYDALAAPVLAAYCEVLHVEADMIRRLDDKFEFSSLASSLGLSVPDSHRITDPMHILNFDFGAHERPYILKSIPYDPVYRLDLTKLPRATPAETAALVARRSISATTPWVLQEFIAGQEFCTHSTVRDGLLQLHCCCRSSAFQLNYEMVDHPAIKAWVETFVSALNLTGQVSFDFIEAADGTVYAIECNPRTHSAITMFYNQPDVAKAYLDTDVATVAPLKSSRPTYWLYEELWRLVSHPTTLATRVRTIVHGKDAIFDWSDPLPFLLVHHLQLPSLLLGNLRHLKDWMRIDVNIGKLVEPAGD